MICRHVSSPEIIQTHSVVLFGGIFGRGREKLVRAEMLRVRRTIVYCRRLKVRGHLSRSNLGRSIPADLINIYGPGCPVTMLGCVYVQREDEATHTLNMSASLHTTKVSGDPFESSEQNRPRPARKRSHTLALSITLDFIYFYFDGYVAHIIIIEA